MTTGVLTLPSDIVHEPTEIELEFDDSFEAAPVEPAPRPGFFRRAGRAFASASEWLFGLFALVGGLATMAAIPVAQFLVLGYLLESMGRVARTGKIRSCWVGVRKAAAVGRMAIGCWLVLLPLRLLATLAADAEIINPGGSYARAWKFVVYSVTVLAVVHIVAACARGGKMRYFLWPFANPFKLAYQIKSGGFYQKAVDAVWNFVVSLSLPHYFRLGLLGYLGSLIWLIAPVALLAAGRKYPVFGILGALALAFVAVQLPLLQARFSAENRFGAIFELKAARREFARAPLAVAFACTLTTLLAIPLYLLKIQILPRETIWLPSIVFLLFIFPARTAAGWAYSRAMQRETKAHWFFRTVARLWLVPVGLVYVAFVYLGQFTAWKGFLSLYEQHAFLLPVPFAGGG